ncbi:hypothetical protein EW146_g5420 [Bondarzewia mesenterica]|uniref:Uncharacterized protein n=1 Tax=Bondarzewia mesenterica TaxID=1095465 RepID=A0A4S4LS58_9AGAM|nr:hypothetical protein EW146_g5420 [Bondarzewia mesenterica]
MRSTAAIVSIALAGAAIPALAVPILINDGSPFISPELDIPAGATKPLFLSKIPVHTPDIFETLQHRGVASGLGKVASKVGSKVLGTAGRAGRVGKVPTTAPKTSGSSTKKPGTTSGPSTKGSTTPNNAGNPVDTTTTSTGSGQSALDKILTFGQNVLPVLPFLTSSSSAPTVDTTTNTDTATTDTAVSGSSTTGDTTAVDNSTVDNSTVGNSTVTDTSNSTAVPASLDRRGSFDRQLRREVKRELVRMALERALVDLD